MPVNYAPPTPEQLLPVRGITLGTAAAGIKRWTRDDVLLVKLSAGSHASGVFTQNRFCAAPVVVCREHLARSTNTRALLINAGNANAGTGESGRAAALTPGGWYAAVCAIMTTDTVPKGASRRIDVEGTTVTVTGIAKGAGMMAPNMATMLAFVATDAPIAGGLLRDLAASIADASFNRVTIDGDTSTNDSFVLIASGQAPLRPIEHHDDPRLAPVRAALQAVAIELSQAIVRDGEGATKFITITVEGGRDISECDHVARRIAHSPLVKTAFFASDPNLGRIVCAIGNAGIADLDPGRVSFWLDEVLVVADGGRAASYRERDGQRVMAKPEISVRVSLGRGEATATVWT